MSNKNMAKETFRDVEKTERNKEYQEFIQIIFWEENIILYFTIFLK